MARGSAGSASMREAIAARTVVGSSSEGPRSSERGGELFDEQRVPFGDLDEPFDRREISPSREQVGRRSRPSPRATAPRAGSSCAPRTPLPQPGRTSSNSDRASARKVAGASRTCDARYSSRSSCAAIRPVDVLEDEHRGLLEGDLLDEPARREEQLDGLLGGLVARTRARSTSRGAESSHRLRPVPGARGPAPRASPMASDGESDSKIPVTWRTCSDEGAVSGLAVREAATADGSAHPSLRSATRSPRPSGTCRSRSVPTIVTRWGRRSAAARSQMESSMLSSRDRPTSGAVVAGRSAGAPIGSSASHASTGLAYPSRRPASSSR